MRKLQGMHHPDTIAFVMRETSLGQELRKRRGTRSLRDLAKETGLSHATLSRIEADLIELPSRDTLDAISRGYGLPLEMLAQLVYLGRREEASPLRTEPLAV